MTLIERWGIGLLVTLAVILGAHYSGYWRGWTASETKWKVERAEIEGAARAREAQLRASGADLEAKLVAARAEVKVQTVEVIREVVKYVRPDRAAFDSAVATRVLNALSGIRETAESAGAAGAAAPSAEAAPDSAGPRTSERGLAEWIAGAVKSHEECRLQANSLIEYARACAASR